MGTFLALYSTNTWLEPVSPTNTLESVTLSPATDHAMLKVTPEVMSSALP